MKLFPRIAVACLAIAAGTGQAAHDLENGIKEIPPDRGLVVFSTSGTKAGFAIGSFLRLIDPESKRVYGSVYYSLDPDKESDFTDELGKMRQIYLRPGEYMFAPDLARMRDWYLPVYKFTVKAGSAIYVGNFWLGKKQYEVRDRSQRDLEIFRTNNPALSAVAFEPLKLEKFCERRELDNFKIIIFKDPTKFD